MACTVIYKEEDKIIYKKKKEENNKLFELNFYNIPWRENSAEMSIGKNLIILLRTNPFPYGVKKIITV